MGGGGGIKIGNPIKQATNFVSGNVKRATGFVQGGGLVGMALGLNGKPTAAPSVAGGGVNADVGRAAIEADIKAGEEGLGANFKEGALGRLDTERSADVKDIIERRRAGLEGISAEENQALRERGSQAIDRGSQTALRQLRGRQASSGVRGATAGAQQASVLQAGQAAKANVERDLLIKNIDAKRQGLSDFEGSVLGAEERGQGKTLFNLEQKQRETFGRLSSGLGMAQLGVQERGSQRGVGIAQANAAAAGKGGKK